MHVVQVVQVIPVVQRMGCCSDPGDPDGLENQAGPGDRGNPHDTSDWGGRTGPDTSRLLGRSRS